MRERAPVATFVLSAVAIALCAYWMKLGAPLHPVTARAVMLNPIAQLIVEAERVGIGWVGPFLLWSIVANVVLAAALAVILIVRSRPNATAHLLAYSLSAFAAAFALLVIGTNLPEATGTSAVTQAPGADGPWAALGPRAASAILAAAAAALLYVAAHTMLRFWGSYPETPDRPSLIAFFQNRVLHPPRGPVARWTRARVRSPATAPDATATARATAIAVARADASTAARFAGTRVGRVIGGWCTVAAMSWWTSSWVAARSAVGDRPMASWTFLGATFALCCLGMVVVLTTDRVADYVAFHRRFASGIAQRRVEWLHAAGTFSGLLLDSYPVVQLVAVVAMIAFPEASDRMFLGTNVFWLTFMISIGPSMMVLALGASIFARGLVDPRLALQRMTVWGLLGLCVTFLFVVVERFVAISLVKWLELPSETGALVAGVSVAATFAPVRRAVAGWVERLIEHRMPPAALADGTRLVGAVAVFDISGFTKLSAQDESLALLTTALLQKEARRAADTLGGRIVKFTGDGAILVFDEAAPAASAVRSVHEAFARLVGTVGLPPQQLHSAIHWGDYVEVHDADIYGNTVNLAARLADRAGPGEILVTEAFARAAGSLAPPATPVGRLQLRNVPAAVECLRL